MTTLLDIFLAFLADALDIAGFACEQTAHAIDGIRRRIRPSARAP